MKHSLLATLVVGIFVVLIVAALQLSPQVVRLESRVADSISSYAAATHVVPKQWQYVFMAILSFGVAALTVTSLRRGRIGLIALGLIIELIAVSWICSLYKVFFQPIPSMLATALAFVIADRYTAIAQRGRSVTARAFFTDRLSKDQMQRVVNGDIPFDPEAKTYETTVVVCDVANKYDLADECEPPVFGKITEEFIRRASDVFMQAGAYIQTADAEGVVALFGFPETDAHHGDKAVRVALEMIDQFRQAQVSNGEQKCDVHLGVSSGAMIVAPLQDGERPGLITSGEPVELARRFCVANRFYGSKVLIGPRTFELASRYIVARPIDFLSGVNSRERHEIYEPLWPAAEAKPEQLARRDCFWNGVVFYREKRWAEAYSEFQKARGPNEEEDAPLQLYLRRLEPLALNLAEMPMRHG
ncbi:MAG TPA: adenylate/guanylate cyclase domain-containing protein [Chthoniobacterales bacterium]